MSETRFPRFYVSYRLLMRKKSRYWSTMKLHYTFLLSKKFIETIEIELKSSSGHNIFFYRRENISSVILPSEKSIKSGEMLLEVLFILKKKKKEHVFKRKRLWKILLCSSGWRKRSLFSGCIASMCIWLVRWPTEKLQPIAMKATSYLGKYLLNTGKNVISDVAAGTSFRDSTRNRFPEISVKVKKDLIGKIQHSGGKKAIKRKCKKQSNHSQNKCCKSMRHDIFS